nr:hypothetical protein Iba_chr02bCG6680 [Ipomoea batatas]
MPRAAVARFGSTEREHSGTQSSSNRQPRTLRATSTLRYMTSVLPLPRSETYFNVLDHQPRDWSLTLPHSQPNEAVQTLLKARCISTGINVTRQLPSGTTLTLDPIHDNSGRGVRRAAVDLHPHNLLSGTYRCNSPEAGKIQHSEEDLLSNWHCLSLRVRVSRWSSNDVTYAVQSRRCNAYSSFEQQPRLSKTLPKDPSLQPGEERERSSARPRAPERFFAILSKCPATAEIGASSDRVTSVEQAIVSDCSLCGPTRHNHVQASHASNCGRDTPVALESRQFRPFTLAAKWSVRRYACWHSVIFLQQAICEGTDLLWGGLSDTMEQMPRLTYELSIVRTDSVT